MAAQMTDGAQKPSASKAYRASGPGEWKQASFLPGNGQVRRSRLPEESESDVGTRALYGAQWSAEETKAGEEVAITASAVGIEDGAQVMITIQQVTGKGLSDVDLRARR